MSARGLSIIVPAFNEAANIEQALAAIRCAAVTAGLDDHEIIVVDDGSTDGTQERARRFASYFADRPDGRPVITVTGYARNAGLRTAYETGLALATMPYVTWAPSDNEMARDSLVAIFQAVGSADLVVPYHGTPERRTRLRRLLTWGSTAQLNWLLGYDLNYWQGTVCLPTELARRLPRTVPGFFFCAEMLAHALDRGLSYVEVPLVHTDRQHGTSKAVSWRAIWNAQKLILRLWWTLRVRTAFQALGFALEHR